MQDTALAAALRRDRWIVVLALLVIAALALGYTFWLATGFDMSGMMSPEYMPWSAGYFAFMLVMWIVMMIGMMTPSVAPMILLYTAIARQSAGSAAQAFAPPGWFLAGYLLAWAAFATARDAAAVVARMAGAGDADDGRHQPRARRHRADRRGCLSMVAGETGLPGFLPRTAVIRATSWRIPAERARLVAAGRAARSLLHRLLLGADAAAVRVRRHEPDLDCRAHGVRAAGEGIAVATRRGAHRGLWQSPRQAWR